MVKSIHSGTRASRRPARAAASEPAQAPLTKRPGGKLGIIIDRLSTKRGATADELVEATGWRRHSVLGALSRLKSRGFVFERDADAARKAYRLKETREPAKRTRVKD